MYYISTIKKNDFPQKEDDSHKLSPDTDSNKVTTLALRSTKQKNDQSQKENESNSLHNYIGVSSDNTLALQTTNNVTDTIALATTKTFAKGDSYPTLQILKDTIKDFGKLLEECGKCLEVLGSSVMWSRGGEA